MIIKKLIIKLNRINLNKLIINFNKLIINFK